MAPLHMHCHHVWALRVLANAVAAFVCRFAQCYVGVLSVRVSPLCRELPVELQKKLGPLPTGFLAYFAGRSV